MKWWALVLGCYGFVVGPVVAGERWSADACRRLQEMKEVTYARNKDDEHLAWMLIPILATQQNNCGVNTEAESDASIAAGPRRKSKTVAPAHRPMNCLAVPMTGGAVATGCN
jgi:hypothetical protein